jgi:hypothetical protein
MAATYKIRYTCHFRDDSGGEVGSVTFVFEKDEKTHEIIKTTYFRNNDETTTQELKQFSVEELIVNPIRLAPF